MFAFEIWGKFASFRDPFTISQNISLPIPPKTTVAGMMASILGVENYFDDSAFNDFSYSIVVINPIRKKSFSQNYINDYTSKVQTHINNLKKGDIEKVSKGFRDKNNPQKPINRELLLNPRYLVIIKDFNYEERIIKSLQERVSKFPLYLGNSEFAGNFKYMELKKFEAIKPKAIKVDSFILEDDIKSINFEEGVRYTKLSFATRLDKNRTPLSFCSVVLGTASILMDGLKVYRVDTEDNTYHCRFV